jgi:hypothetical protein
MWLKYEEGKDLSDDGKLRTTSCPVCIAAWIAWAHSAKWRPIIKDANEFEEQFWCWWTSVQPEWRKDLEQGEGDWQVLQKPGANGIISVLAALFYWGIALGDRQESSLGWLRALGDVKWVLQQL